MSAHSQMIPMRTSLPPNRCTRSSARSFISRNSAWASAALFGTRTVDLVCRTNARAPEWRSSSPRRQTGSSRTSDRQGPSPRPRAFTSRSPTTRTSVAWPAEPGDRRPWRSRLAGRAEARDHLLGLAQVLRQRLQELPADDAVSLDQRAELPEREPVADEVFRRGDRRDARSLVDQRDLAEVVARPQRRPQLPTDCDADLARLDDVEGGPARAFLDHRLTLGEAALLEQAGDLRHLVAVEIGEEPHALHDLHRSARGRRLLGRARPRDRPALEEIQLPLGERPLDVPVGAVDLLAAARQPVEVGELGIVQTELFGEFRRKGLLERPALGELPDGDLLQACPPLEHLSRAVDPEVVGDHEAGDDGLPEPPARLDHALVRAVDRVPGEHHAGRVGVEQRLDDDAHARPPEQPDALAVGDRRVRVGGPPDLPERLRHRAGAGDVEQRQVLPGEARLGPVLVDRRRAYGERAAERPDELRHVLDRLLVAPGHGFDDGSCESDAGRERQAGPRRLPQPDRLGPVKRLVLCLLERDDAVHQRTVTSPAFPSTRTRAPSGISPVPSRVPTTPGTPYSRETIAACERSPPASVTIAPSSGSRMLNASVVDSVTRTSPRTMRSNSVGPAISRAVPS